MPFSAAELSSIFSSLLDHHERSPAMAQHIQDRPLVDALMKGKKTFGGGKDYVTCQVKGDRTFTNQFFSHNDTVIFKNSANVKQAKYAWKELHTGMSCTETELKKAGIHVLDENSSSIVESSDQELYVLTNILDEKIDDLNEDSMYDFNQTVWLDGSQNSKAFPGIMAFIADNPLLGTVGGLSGAVLPWWRNRALTSSYASGNGVSGTATDGRITSSASNGGALIKVLQREWKQLRRYGGAKRTIWLAGSDFIEALETELRANGSYSDSGFTRREKTDAGMADIYFKGNQIIYDPTLDDIAGYSKRCYIIDLDGIRLRPMEKEEWKIRNPARPSDQYVFYRGKTWTGAMDCKRRNGSGVYEIN